MAWFVRAWLGFGQNRGDNLRLGPVRNRADSIPARASQTRLVDLRPTTRALALMRVGYLGTKVAGNGASTFFATNQFHSTNGRGGVIQQHGAGEGSKIGKGHHGREPEGA